MKKLKKSIYYINKLKHKTMSHILFNKNCLLLEMGIGVVVLKSNMLALSRMIHKYKNID